MPDINMQVFEEVKRNQLVTEVDIQTQVALDDYQVQLSDIANPTQSQDNVVIDRNGEFLPHWNESLDFDTWIKMSMEVAGKRILMLRGNSSISSVSSGDSVFINFDGFEDALQGDWTTVFTPMNYAATGDYYSGLQSMQVGASGDRGGGKWGVAFEENVVISFMWKRTSTNPLKLIGGDASTTIYVIWTGDLLQYYDGAQQGSYSLPLATGWNKITIKDIDFVANTYDICVGDDETIVYNDIEMWSSSAYDDFIEFFNDDTVGFGYVDNIYARKYTTTEPKVTVGASKNIAAALKSLGRAG